MAGSVTSVESQDFVEIAPEAKGGKLSDILGIAAPLPVIGPFAGVASGILKLFGGGLSEVEQKKLGLTQKESDTLKAIHDRARTRARRKK